MNCSREFRSAGAADVDAAVAAALKAYPAWRATPPVHRVRLLFAVRELLEQHFDQLATILTLEHGKTLDESRSSVRRAIDNVEVACAIPTTMQGRALEDIATGIDCHTFRQPMGVFAAITPFNFPAMVPMWFLPHAIACGNTFIVKPSERVPMSQVRIFELLHEAGIPEGVVNLVHGAKDAVNAILDHPGIAGVSFVGSSPVAHHVYKRAAESGKRVQALGGAKNFVLVMPDADMARAAQVSDRVVLRLRRRTLPRELRWCSAWARVRRSLEAAGRRGEEDPRRRRDSSPATPWAR